MRAAASISCVFALALAGCQPEDEDPFYLRGAVVDGEGKPAAGARVHAESAFTTGEADFVPRGDATAADDGSFVMEVPYSALMNHMGNPSFFRLTPPAAVDGRAVSLQFLYYGSADVSLPTLRPASIALTVASGAGLHLETASPASGESAPVSMIELVQGDAPVWREGTSAADFPLPPELLEDFPGLQAQAHVLETGEKVFRSLLLEHWASVDYMLDTRTAPVPLAAGTLVPVSRGAACGFTNEKGVCPLTDGLLERVELPEAQEMLDFTLPSPHAVRRLVLRGAYDWAPLVVEGSDDGGASWMPLGKVVGSRNHLAIDRPGPALVFVMDEFESVDLTSERAVSQVRLRVDGGPQSGYLPRALREISIFE